MLMKTLFDPGTPTKHLVVDAGLSIVENTPCALFTHQPFEELLN
jgi:hypothetical protein